NTVAPGTANDIAWACALAPDAVSDPAIPLHLAQRAVAKDRSSNSLNTLAAVLYRAGRFEQAVRTLNQGIAMQKDGGTADDFVFLAMAHQRLGHRAEARRWLGLAVRWVRAHGAE